MSAPSSKDSLAVFFGGPSNDAAPGGQDLDFEESSASIQPPESLPAMSVLVGAFPDGSSESVISSGDKL